VEIAFNVGQHGVERCNSRVNVVRCGVHRNNGVCRLQQLAEAAADEAAKILALLGDLRALVRVKCAQVRK
jgi:hypothetical protein